MNGSFFSLNANIQSQSIRKKASIQNAISQSEFFRISKEEAAGKAAEMGRIIEGWRQHFKQCGVTEPDIRALENSFAPKP